MAYSSFLGNAKEAEVRESPLESAAAGVSVGRLEWGPKGLFETVTPREAVLASDFDVVVVRYPSEQFGVSEALAKAPLRAIYADTLLYFGINAPSSPKEIDKNRALTASDQTVVQSMAREVFAGYTNHHSANSTLAQIGVADAYADWASRCLSATQSLVFMPRHEGTSVGLCVLDLSQDDIGEVMLAGIHPEHRREGHYARLLNSALSATADAGKKTLVISTQSSNLPALRAWCRMGMEPLLSLTTLHVSREPIWSDERK